ncbi:MAG: hypothetical protein J0H98_10710 [Solirubrobacterales bacterium]|nr:hypothetical protein [Solirubrobacterales bacterium]
MTTAVLEHPTPGPPEESPDEARRLADALAQITAPAEGDLQVPPPVVAIEERKVGTKPLLTVEALELARKTYYEQGATLAETARTLLRAEVVADTNDVDKVYGRLQTWWAREGWPRRSMMDTFRIRDANHDGGLFRSNRKCIGVATGNGRAEKGAPCGESPLPDSDYCASHDPRPQYVEARKKAVEKLLAGRKATMVTIGPLAEELERRCELELTAAKAAGKKVHHNSTGRGLVAAKIGIDNTAFGRLLGQPRSDGRGPLTHVTVKTVLKCLAPFEDVSFEDLYGHPPPESNQCSVCPSCGGRKTPAAKTCRTCHDDSTFSQRCRHTTRSGRRCPVTTEHPTGYCSKCRTTIFRVRVPSTRQSHLHPKLVLFALDAFQTVPTLAGVARRIWATNAADVRAVYTTRRTLESGLVKTFRNHRWTSCTYAAEQARLRLEVDHGPVAWPEILGDEDIGGTLQAGPFIGWLRVQVAAAGTFKEAGKRTGLNPDLISQLIRHEGPDWISARVVRSAMARAGSEIPLTHLFVLEDMR